MLTSRDVIYLRDRWDREVRADFRRIRFWSLLWGFSFGLLFAVIVKGI